MPSFIRGEPFTVMEPIPILRKKKRISIKLAKSNLLNILEETNVLTPRIGMSPGIKCSTRNSKNVKLQKLNELRNLNRPKLFGN